MKKVPDEAEDKVVEVWHYTTTRGKRKLVQHFKTQWTVIEPGKSEPKKTSRRKKAS